MNLRLLLSVFRYGAQGWRWGLAALAVMPLTAACFAPIRPVVKLGLMAPLAGEAADEGYRWVFAAKQAVAEWNSAPGRVVQVELVSHDESDGSVSARRLAADPAVVGVVGHWRPDVAEESRATYTAAGLTVLSLAHGGCNAQEGPVLCIAPSREALTGAVAQFTRGRVAQASVAIVAGPDIIDLSQAGGLQSALSRAGLRVVRTEAALPYVSSFREMASRLAAENPDVVVFAGSLVASLAFARDVPPGRAVRVYVPHRYTPALESAAPAFRLAPYGEPAGAAFSTFRDAFQQLWGGPPSPEAAAVYDATRMLLRTLDQASARPADRRAEVAAAVRSGDAFAGALGAYTAVDGRLQLSATPAVVALGR